MPSLQSAGRLSGRVGRCAPRLRSCTMFRAAIIALPAVIVALVTSIATHQIEPHSTRNSGSPAVCWIPGTFLAIAALGITGRRLGKFALRAVSTGVDEVVDIAAVIERAHTSWAEDRHVEAIQLYVRILQATGATGNAPGTLQVREHLQCHANLASSYMQLAGQRSPQGTAPHVEQREALLAASLQHWQVAKISGPGSPLLDFFIASVSRDFQLTSAAADLLRMEHERPTSRSEPVIEPMERRDAAGLSYAEFMDKYVARGTPVVITGLDVPQWDLSYLEELCGDSEVPRLQYDPSAAGEDWAALPQLAVR